MASTLTAAEVNEFKQLVFIALISRMLQPSDGNKFTALYDTIRLFRSLDKCSQLQKSFP